ncbi:MAG TPA: ankyrin repeat domain-containing protein, partial [Vicinamibacteria bacterium]
MILALLLSLLALDQGEELREAARRGEVEKAKALLDAGVPVDSKNRYGATALFFAADRGHVPMLELLLARGASIEVEDSFYGMTALARAFASRHEDAAVLLLRHTLDAGKLDRKSYDEILEEAKSSNLTKIVSLLESTPPPAPSAGVERPPEKLDLGSFVGRYRTQEKGEILIVERSGDGLVLRLGERTMALAESGEREFSLEGGAGTLGFGGRAGMVEYAVLTRGSESDYAPREEADVLSDAKLAGPSGDLRAEVKAPAPWPSFRGPNGSGIADGQRVPLEWDSGAKKNIRFETPIEGFSVSSPIVWGNRIFVLSAVSSASDRTFRTGLYGDVTPVDDLSEHRWLLYAIDTGDGRIVWERELERKKPGTKRHPKSSQANA